MSELSTAQIDSIEDLEKFLGCGGIGSFTHVQVADAGGALELATDLAIENPVLQGHSVFVEAVSIGGLAHGPEAWVIVDAEGFLVGDVDTSGYVFLCENKPADFKPVDVGTPYPPCKGPDERNDPECRP